MLHWKMRLALILTSVAAIAAANGLLGFIWLCAGFHV